MADRNSKGLPNRFDRPDITPGLKSPQQIASESMSWLQGPPPLDKSQMVGPGGLIAKPGAKQVIANHERQAAEQQNRARMMLAEMLVNGGGR